jgi:uncharacterized protein (TIGR02757 family)
MDDVFQTENLRDFLEEKVEKYNCKDFIFNDPISIPHCYSLQQDIEITGFWAAVLAWGQRKTIIKKCEELFSLMDNSPYDFILNHQEHDKKIFHSFKHRTFNYTDTLFFLEFFQQYYRKNISLEDAFLNDISSGSKNIEKGLINFHRIFFELPYSPQRTQKHIATPARNSACKRINMFLRWMVRKDDKGVDFGLWNKISPAQLIAPCDVHVDRVARKLGLILRRQTDWLTALELTDNLLKMDPEDPIKYDFALFSLGIDSF